jgi:uncharacterized protein (TIGR02271 family)
VAAGACVKGMADFMNSYASILPGARVRSPDGFIGTVERLDYHWADSSEQPDRMIVRSDDGHWRYSIPLMFISGIAQGAFHPIVELRLNPDELTHYIVEQLEPQQNARPTPAPEPAGNAAAQETTAATSDGEAQSPVLRVPVAVEELIVHKEPILRGKVHVHKGVETVEQHVDVPVYHEEAVVERIPADRYDGATATPNEVLIPILEERLVVRKESVVTEYIRVRKELVRDQKQVRGQVRREVVRFDEERLGDANADTYPLLRDTSAAGDKTAAPTERADHDRERAAQEMAGGPG